MDTLASRPSRLPLLRRRWFPWAVVGALIVAAFPLAALAAFAVGEEQERDPPTCHGIGFGCVPDPWSTAILLAMMFYVPAVGGLSGLLGLLELFGPRGQPARSAVALVSATALVGLALVFVMRVAL